MSLGTRLSVLMKTYLFKEAPLLVLQLLGILRYEQHQSSLLSSQNREQNSAEIAHLDCELKQSTYTLQH